MAKKKTKKINKKLLIAVIVIVALCAAAAIYAAVMNKGSGSAQDASATDYIQIDIENYGTITAELYGNVAPITVKNFMKLVDDGFYNGLTFHRIISGFMIQGGDPLGTGMGGAPDKIKGEFKANGVENNIDHTRGVLSMARSQMYDSASSQFFIMHADAPHLNGQYAAFGRVLTGIEVVDAICQNTPVTDRNGSVAAANQPKITNITRIEKPAA
ncbi:MAG: peptidylprolyl isomerase [Clostridia bacterium]|nr:peptidylprolyl isomerase [Clostridia bacterium]